MKKMALSLILACGVAMAAEANATDTNKTETNATAATSTVDAKALFAQKCASCHGADGKTKALGKSNPIAGLDVKTVEEDLKGYKAGTLNKHGMGGVMKGNVAALSDEELKALAEYISKLAK